MSGLFSQAWPEPHSFEPRHEFPAADDWSVTPGALALRWGEMWGQVEEVRAEVAPQVRAIEQEIARLREAKAPRDEIKALQELRDRWNAAAGALDHLYNYAFEQWADALNDAICERIKPLGLDEDDHDRLATEIGEAMWPDRPALDWNADKTLEEIYDLVLADWLAGEDQEEEPADVQADGGDQIDHGEAQQAPRPARTPVKADQMALFGV